METCQDCRTGAGILLEGIAMGECGSCHIEVAYLLSLYRRMEFIVYLHTKIHIRLARKEIGIIPFITVLGEVYIKSEYRLIEAVGI